MKGNKLYFYCLLLALACGFILPPSLAIDLQNRVLPLNENCDPRTGTCLKGDWVSESIADCSFDGSWFSTCTAKDDSAFHWVVEPEANGNCLPVSGKPIHCGGSGTNTRCVCSSPKLPFNECRCQYWPAATQGASQNAFCTAYYIHAGTSGAHHYACCNNCNDPDSSCDGLTWQGGSTTSYCSTCGNPTGGGVDKYYFNCGDCQTQSTCRNRCNEDGLIGLDWPTLCWKWVDCFAGCCRHMASQFARHRRQSTTMEFCGDGTCQQSSENPDTCPTDCCYLKNSTCTTIPARCTRECCQTATCCSESRADPLQQMSFLLMFTIITAVVAVHLYDNQCALLLWYPHLEFNMLILSYLHC